jgi:putative membrane protein
MRGYVVRTLVSALGLAIASAIVPGLQIQGPGTLLLAAVLLGIVNAFVRPILLVLTFPITVVTLGAFLLVLNAAMLGLVAALLAKFSIAGLGSALLGAIVVGLTSWVGSWYIGPKGQIEVFTVEYRDGRAGR